MILVHVPSGGQRQYGSPDELVDAIRRGELDPDARIYHRAAARWLPITVHPEFRRRIAERLPEPLPPLARTKWTFFATESSEQEAHSAPEPAGPARQDAIPQEKPASGWRRMFGRAKNRDKQGKD
jgi:hypothetical protein